MKTLKPLLLILLLLNFLISSIGQFTRTDNVGNRLYSGVPFDGEPWKMPCDDFYAWKFDKVCGTSIDLGIVAGNYYPSSTDGGGQDVRSDYLSGNFPVFKWNGGAFVLRNSGQWLRYTCEFSEAGEYHFKFRSRHLNANTLNMHVTVETPDSLQGVDSIEITNNSGYTFINLEENYGGNTSWYLSSETLTIPEAGIYVIRVDITSAGVPGVFGEFNMYTKEWAKVDTLQVEIVDTILSCGDPYNFEAITDFDYEVDGYDPGYIDGGRQALAIDASTYMGGMAAATTIFDGPAGYYDVKVRTLTETDGESEYTVYSNDSLVGTYKNPETEIDYAPSDTTFSGVFVNFGDTLKVEYTSETNGKIPEGDTTAFSRGRWTNLILTQTSSVVIPGEETDTNIFVEQDGMVVIEMESLPISGDWQVNTSRTGFTGTGYIEWLGSQYFNDASNGRVSAKVLISKPGTYKFNWRCGVNFGSSSTEHNDTWLKIEANDFYAEKNDNYVHPRPLCNTSAYECPEGGSDDGFFKIYGGSLSGFQWKAVTYDNNSHDVYADFNAPGIYTLTIAARSSHHVIDRMVLKHFLIDDNDAEDLSIAESIRATEITDTLITPCDTTVLVSYKYAGSDSVPEACGLSDWGNEYTELGCAYASADDDLFKEHNVFVSNSSLNVSLNGTQQGYVTIYSVQGVKVFEDKVSEQYNRSLNIPSGIYLLKLSVGNKEQVTKFFITQ